MHDAYLLFGSNINPVENLRRAVAELCTCCQLKNTSTAWETVAIGSANAPNFLNLAAWMQTEVDARTLKEAVMRPLEARLGRVRTADKNAPRTLDIDIILFDGVVLDEALWQRNFIAIPMAELLPDLIHPETGERLADLAARLLPGSGAIAHPEIKLCP